MADIAASVLARLKNKAAESGRTYQLCLQLFCQEEFLRRLEKSKYVDNLILKGGLFIYSVTNFDSRVTVDVDFLLRKVPNTPEELKPVLEEIIGTSTGNNLGDVPFGVWYIRLRDKKRTQTPFDGVVKVEKIMMDKEIDNGIDSDVIDLISANIINERNPTCYGTDRRWANHLYPVFLTESYVKSRYISTEMFLHLF